MSVLCHVCLTLLLNGTMLLGPLSVNCKATYRVDLAQASLGLRVCGSAQVKAIDLQDLVTWQQATILGNHTIWEDFLHNNTHLELGGTKLGYLYMLFEMIT